MLETWWEESTTPGIAAYRCYKTSLPIYRRVKQEDGKWREIEVGRSPYVMLERRTDAQHSVSEGRRFSFMPYTEAAYAQRLLREVE